MNSLVQKWMNHHLVGLGCDGVVYSSRRRFLVMGAAATSVLGLPNLRPDR
jgi:hypothetical protein